MATTFAMDNKKPNLRYYQEDCAIAVTAFAAKGHTALLCVEPTASGKSIIMAEIAARILPPADAGGPRKKALFVSHRKELDKQNSDAFLLMNPGKTAGFEKANQICPKTADAMFASILTVGKTKLERIRRWATPSEIAVVFIDEAHHIPGGKTYQVLLKELREENPEIIFVGVTATPNRMDGQTLWKYFGTTAHETPMEELIEAGYLAGLRGVSVNTDTTLEGVTQHAGDFTISGEHGLSNRINNPLRNALAAKIHREKHMGQKAMVFAVSKDHAAAIQLAFELEGIRVTTITEDSSPIERDNLKENIRNHTYDVVVSVGCLTEGFDLPEIAVIYAMRPTRSPVFLSQMLGRGLRLITEPDPNRPGWFRTRTDLKTHCTVYDFVDLKATEAGAQKISSVMGIPDHINITLEGECLSEAQGIITLCERNVVMASQIMNAKTLAEIEQLLLPINLLERCLGVRYANADSSRKSEMGWIETPEGYLLLLAEGELCVIKTNALGQTIFLRPEIKLGRREHTLAGVQRRAPKPVTNIPARDFVLNHALANDLVFVEAEKHLQQVIPYDIHCRGRNRQEKKGMATANQIVMITNLELLDAEEYPGLTKEHASRLIDAALTSRKYLSQNGFMPAGPYQSVELDLLALRHPEYLEQILRNGLAEEWRVKSQTHAALEKCPLDWMKTNRRGIYMSQLRDRHDTLEKAWKQGHRDSVRSTVLRALGKDPQCPWTTLRRIADERAEISRRRAPHMLKKAVPMIGNAFIQAAEAKQTRTAAKIAAPTRIAGPPEKLQSFSWGKPNATHQKEIR